MINIIVTPNATHMQAMQLSAYRGHFFRDFCGGCGVRTTSDAFMPVLPKKLVVLFLCEHSPPFLILALL
jgi:hypothetical protein